MQNPDRAPESRYAGRHRIVDHRAPSVPGYDVVEPIGQGGSGSVWSATSSAGESVAIKVVPAFDAQDALVELAVLGRLHEPHLVRLHEATALPSGDVALVLDHLAGGTLGAAVRARGHLAPGEVVSVLSPIASAVGRLHGVGVVHGDLSPDNVLLDLDGQPFLADLGVARIVGEQPGEPRGTEGFVAPEVLLGAIPTTASDVHALGALAWFCLTGEAPGPAVLRGRLGDRVPGLGDELVAAVEGALRSRPEDRPGADALAVAIFESAPAQPLVLVRGEDDVSLLTRRIRACARAESAVGARGGVGEKGAARRTLLGARLRRRAVEDRWSARVGSLLRRTGGALRGLVPWLAVVAVVSALTLGIVSWTAGRQDAVASSSGPQGAGPDSGHERAPAADLAPTDPRCVPDAPDRDPVGLVQALADARALAWSTGVAARLVEVDAPRSPAMTRDTEVLAGVQRAHQRYAGLTFVVRDATVVGASDGVTTIRAAIDTGAHVVRGPGGDQPRGAVPGDAVLLDLMRTDSGWRVHDVRSP
ncbi:serine/threonine protein kinase [Knoellia sp. Soil729]|uniref:serine/threonine protein kinase n=1 Tax=Knoellia sp. Soil729 TaxID=1736394 RepID=UPI0006FF7FAE|nr:serine/threonine-protein kinase [Knoellia sp. Soil729]KRE40996.1 hypothetical protein ASG74_14075 [Knoellia sp. Soil729]